MTNLGRFSSVYQIRESADPSMTDGPVVRLDWLRECGLEWNSENLPTTIDDWYTIMKAFNTQYGAVTLWNSTGVQFAGAWGIDVSSQISKPAVTHKSGKPHV